MNVQRFDGKVGELELVQFKPAVPNGSPPLLFVHGAWHGAWCWADQWMPYFAGQGYDCWAPSLRGHGRSGGQYRGATVSDYLADLRAVIAHLGVRPIVIGHSMGAFLTQHLLAADPLAGAVLVAPIPHTGFSLGALAKTTARHPGRVARSFAARDMWPMVDSPEVARELFFSARLPAGDVERHWKHLCGESFRGFFQLGPPPLGKRPSRPRAGVPIFVVAGDGDRFFPPAELERTAHALGAQFEVISRCPHDVMLDVEARFAAERVHTWLQARLSTHKPTPLPVPAGAARPSGPKPAVKPG